MIVVGTCSALGLGAGIYSAHRLFKPSPLISAIKNVAKDAQEVGAESFVS